MKKLVILFYVVLIFNKAVGQQKKFYVGALEGVTTSQVSGSQHQGFHKYGMVGGAFVKRTLFNRSFYIQFEALYKEKGTRYYAPQSNAASPTTAYLLRLNYIEFPLLLQYNFDDKFNIKGLYAEVGPSYGILVHKEEYKTEAGYNVLQYGPPIKSGDFGYNIGISYLLPSNFGFNLRFSRSIASIRGYMYGNKVTLFTPGQQNTTMSLTMFYQFPFK